MSLRQFSSRVVRVAPRQFRGFTSSPRFLNESIHKNAEEYRADQKDKSLNPHLTNTTSTISNEFPSIGKDKAPPELISAVETDFTPKDSVPENTERMTGGTQKGSPEGGVNADLGVGEMEGVKFKVEPKRRTGEDANTMRARLLCPSHVVALLLFASNAFLRDTTSQEESANHSMKQIRAESGERLRATCSSPPSPTATWRA